ncbi:DNA replication/repair protein RecF [Patulibacter sp.]|uniref:DNA replication/repair protein RecF n=1 Tax=Patulibacter sp. TaxID=1912859 RepID=UPI00271984B4|nr:DNA replication and repair protein RecF [Patulibacter sp.]MDO9410129.1 DNA replication and repair protein RecF [Patulibacter sp.]
MATTDAPRAGTAAVATHLVGLRVRDVRTYVEADVELGPGLTVVAGPNGAGKTNLLEAAYLACTGRSFRQAADADLVRRGAEIGHAAATVMAPSGPSVFSVGIDPAAPRGRRLRVDGSPVETLLDHPARPRMSVFLPDRMVLVKGGPALRRAHLDQLLAVLRPASMPVRRAFHEALRQRNALLSSLRARGVDADRAGQELAPWDRTLAEAAAGLTVARRETAEAIRPAVNERAAQLGLSGELEISYRPRAAEDPEVVLAALQERHAGDLERGFTHHGPHRDDLAVRRDGRLITRFGSQGEQRLSLLALLLGEADVMEDASGSRPVLLLDDVMSELDADRRERLVGLISERGQALVTVTEASHVPGADDAAVGRIDVTPGSAVATAVAGGRRAGSSS